MSKKSLVQFAVCFTMVNALSGVIALHWADWVGLYTLLVSGPVSGPLLHYLRPLSSSGFTDRGFRLICFVPAVLFSALCAILDKRYMVIVAAVLWVGLGLAVLVLSGIFA